jgi:hypothetical protein
VSTISRLVVIMLFDGVGLLDVTGPAEVFSLLRRETDGAAGYQVVLAARTMDPVTTYRRRFRPALALTNRHATYGKLHYDAAA